MIPDGLGGVLVAWVDYRSGEDLYVQRIQADGSVAPGWTPDGVAMSLASGTQDSPSMISDGSGGAFLTWQDSRDYGTHKTDIYAQHVTASGSIAIGWPANGLPVCTSTGEQRGPNLASDGSGGMFITWTDSRTSQPTSYAQHLMADGSIAAGWGVDGLPMSPGRYYSQTLADNAGGFYIANASPGGFAAANIYLQRYTSTGASVPGWPVDGLLVCGAPEDRSGPWVVADGFGGVLLTWYDYRPPYNFSGAVFASRVLPSGVLAPGWAVDGTLVTNPSPPGAQYQYSNSIAPDGMGGAYVEYILEVNDHGGFVQHLTGNGAVYPGWPPYGARISPTYDQGDAYITSDGTGGAIAAWSEPGRSQLGVFAQRFALDGPVPVQLSLVSAEVKNGRVVLDWFSPDAAVFDVTIYRRTESSSWVSLGGALADGTGHIRYEDLNATAGMRYSYRLGYVEQGVERFTSEAWIDVPAAKLALDGLRPNPASGALTVSFSLAASEPASLEVLDVTGRRVMQRDVGSLGAGPHMLKLGETGSLQPGVYWLRLRQGETLLRARGAVVR